MHGEACGFIVSWKYEYNYLVIGQLSCLQNVIAVIPSALLRDVGNTIVFHLPMYRVHSVENVCFTTLGLQDVQGKNVTHKHNFL